MKKIVAVATALALTGSAALAVEPVVIQEAEAPAIVEASPASNAGWLIPALAFAVVIAVIASSDSDSTPVR